MRAPRLRTLLYAVCLLPLFAGCSSDAPSGIAAPDGAVYSSQNGQRLTLVSGNGQAGAPGQVLPQPIVIQVTDTRGRPVANGVINFLAGGDASADPRQTRTDAAGYARAYWTLSSAMGEQTLRVSGNGGTVLVTANARKPAGITLVKAGGDGQTSAAGTVLIQPIQLRALRDTIPVSALPVTWTVTGGGRVDIPVTPTNAGGYAIVRWTLGPKAGAHTLTARAPGADPVVFTATASGPARGAVLRIAPDSLVLQAGTTGAFTATLRDAAGAEIPNQVIVWTSSNAAVAVVDSTGRVRALTAGTVIITARLGALSASATVRVRSGPSTLRISPDSLVLALGSTGTLTAVVRDAAGNVVTGQTPVWTSGARVVASVDAAGTVTGAGTGTTYVTATVGTLTASARVRVVPAPVTIPLIQNRVSSTGGYIDVSSRDVTLNFWIHASERDVTTMTMRVRSPRGHVEECGNVDAENWFRDEFRCQVYLSRGADPGLWRVDRVTVTKNGQTVAYSSADLDRMGTAGRAFSVLGTGTDVQAPDVRNVWPHQGTRYADRYYIQFGIIDYISGVRAAQATFRGPGGVTQSCNLTSTDGALPRAADWLCLMPWRAGSGPWNLVSVSVEDAAGNRATHTAQQIAQWGGVFESTFQQFEFRP
ncbi:Ig-like domain-containing protein [Longimicrobium terrae]|uniref:BIG2 domain-containing protein n=1 Tax=Longimicrobium terrae TaxID=1639882 RepID=A0A841GW58_9BACT|nr:Ig-like domain-containing protein [Longimicrobium terrae]MBB4634870.1 hypothetical protein [Longimicrobium terrae]MBB6069265.1 hypothetical protein [Longimicrobium terrae]NNC31926.1 hypothetical protein [Longimicrobium terrae]